MSGRSVLLRPGEGPAYAVAGGVYIFKATGQQTGGAYALFEILIPPGGGVPPHVHTHEEEAFYLLEGELNFEVEGVPVRASAGTFIHFPREVPHAFTNQADRSARLLAWAVPAGIEDFFSTVGQVLPGGTETPPVVTQDEMQSLIAAAPKHGIHILAAPRQ